MNIISDNTTHHDVKTKANARAEAVETKLTINWAEMEREDLIALAAQTLVIKLQSAWRNSTIPAGEHTVQAHEHKVGVRAPRKPTDLFAAAAKMSPEERAKLLAMLQA